MNCTLGRFPDEANNVIVYCDSVLRRRSEALGIRVAVASSDGKTVNEHFGRARRFMIFTLEDGAWHHLEDRENLPPCVGHEHNDDLLEQTAELIADCRGVVVSQVGSGAVDALLARRIFPFMLTGTIAEALALLAASRRFHYIR